MNSGFKDRVDKIFASISSSSSSSSSSWSLSDGEVERREWNRGTTESRDDNQIPVSSSFQDLDENWDIRSSIGLDSTLDNEEEEDAYDQMAQGRENNAGPLLYMKDVNDHGHYLNSNNILPKRAAKTRLEEDDADEPMLNAEDAAIKSILKRKSRDDVAEKPAKRVRFDSTCKDKEADADACGARRDPARVSQNVRAVPDYVLNPSNYTRYSLDDSEDYLEPSPKHGEKSYELLPKSVVFIPRRKSGGDESGKRSSNRACANVGIASVESEEMKEDDDDDNDDVCTKARCRKPIRRYRAKMEDCEDVS